MKVYFIKNESEIYLYENDRIIKQEFKKEKAIYTSSISLKDMFVYNFKLPVDIPEDEIEIEAEKHIFKEATLDFTKDYVIKFNINKLDNFYLIDAFIVDYDILKNKFDKFIKKIKYIDFVSATPHVFSSFYELSINEPKNDAFIYFDKDEAYVSFFKDKKFLYVKNIDKLSKVAKELSISEEELVNILETKGLNKELYDDLVIFEKINNFFSQFFIKVNNLINYSINLYNLEKIDNIYFYSPINIAGFLENIKGFWQTLGINFELLKINSEYDPFDVIVTYFNAKNYQNDNINFSIFKRPPPFYKLEVGKFILFVIFLSILVLSIVVVEWISISSTNNKIKDFDNKIKEIKSNNLKIVKEYKKLVKINNNLQQNIIKMNDKINFIENKLLLLNKINTNSDFLIKYNIIVKGLEKYHLKAKSFKKEDKKYEIILNSSNANSKSIAKYLIYLIKNNFKNVKVKKILNKDNTYSSKVTFND